MKQKLIKFIEDKDKELSRRINICKTKNERDFFRGQQLMLIQLKNKIYEIFKDGQ